MVIAVLTISSLPSLFDLAFGFALILLGVSAGLWWRDRIIGGAKNRKARGQRAQKLLASISKWTNGLAGDVLEFRSLTNKLNDHIRSVSVGGNGAIDDQTLELLSQIMTINDDLQKRLEEAESSLQKKAVEVAEYLSEARTDALTGLANRRAFDDEIGRRFSEWERYASPFSLVVFDIDHFKKFNDTHGHVAGDAVLKDVGTVLNSVFRDTDVAFRYGGEEFAVILPAVELKDGAIAALRLRDALERHTVDVGGIRLRVTISSGVAEVVEGDNIRTLIERADSALYAAKERGRNAVNIHDGISLAPAERYRSFTAGPEIPVVLEGVCKGLRNRLLQLVDHHRSA